MKLISKRVRLADVSATAHVSRTAASLILNGKDASFRPETRERVFAAAKDLGYVPPPLPRACGKLKAQNPKGEIHIGFLYRVVEGGFHSPYIFETFSEIINSTQAEKGLVIPVPVGIKSNQEEHGTIPPLLLDHDFDGVVIMMDAVTPALRHFLHSREIPMILLDNHDEGLSSSCVRIDNTGGSRLAAEHLLQQGYPQVAVIAGNPQVMPGEDRWDARERVEGAGLAIKAAGLEWNEGLVAVGDFNIEGGTRGVAELLQRLRPPLGIVCPNDRAAIGALQECRRRGLRVPDDVGLVGFDDLRELTETVNPSMSSVRVPWRQLGREAGQRLLKDIFDPQHDRVVVTCPVELIVRESSMLNKGAAQRSLPYISELKPRTHAP